MSIISDVTDVIGIKSLADFYVLKNTAKLQEGLAKSQNTINELTARAELTKAQTALAQSLVIDPQKSRAGTIAGIDSKKIIGFGLLFGGAFLAYKWLK